MTVLFLDDNLNFTTHVQNLKCGISIDKPGPTLTATGVGHKLWRSYHFVKTARFLLKRYFQNPALDCDMGQYETSPISEVSESGPNANASKNVSHQTFTSTPMINNRNLALTSDNRVDMIIGTIHRLEDQINFLRQEVIQLRKQSAQTQPVVNHKTNKEPSVINISSNDTPLSPVSQPSLEAINSSLNSSRPQHTAISRREARSSLNTHHNSQTNSRTLLIGSSILSGINPKGLKKGVMKPQILTLCTRK